MKPMIGTVMRALVIAGVWGAIGIAVNLYASKPLPWVYVPPKEISVEGVTVPLIDEKEARRFFSDAITVFVDSRTGTDYEKSRVKGAIFLSPYFVEERFPIVEPQLPLEGRVILYCYGPECDMAEEVAKFLAKAGYRNMMIMSAGFKAWQKAGYPVETGTAGCENVGSGEQGKRSHTRWKIEDSWRTSRSRLACS